MRRPPHITIAPGGSATNSSNIVCSRSSMDIDRALLFGPIQRHHSHAVRTALEKDDVRAISDIGDVRLVGYVVHGAVLTTRTVPDHPSARRDRDRLP